MPTKHPNEPKCEGDVIVFAKGDQDQPVSPVNGDDEHYK